MRLRSFFCFYGGKHRIAARYPAPEHANIIEPFAGSAGYATLYHDRNVTLVEKDERIAALWQYLTRVKPAEVLSLPLVGLDESLDDIVAPSEAKSLIGFWLQPGTSAPGLRPSTWMRQGRNPWCHWGPAVRERIAVQVESIRHWRVICGDFEAAPDVEATWFIDPPYQVAGKHYRCKMAPADFERLAGWARTRRGLAIVCENDGAAWLPFEPFVVAKANQANNGGKRSREAIYIQRTGCASADMPLFAGAA